MEQQTTNSNILSISVHETIFVSDWPIIGLIIERITTWDFDTKGEQTIVSIAEYRKILGDNSSTDKQIKARLQFLESFCRNIIKPELKTYEQSKKIIR